MIGEMSTYPRLHRHFLRLPLRLTLAHELIAALMTLLWIRPVVDVDVFGRIVCLGRCHHPTYQEQSI